MNRPFNHIRMVVRMVYRAKVGVIERPCVVFWRVCTVLFALLSIFAVFVAIYCLKPAYVSPERCDDIVRTKAGTIVCELEMLTEDSPILIK